LKQEGIIDDEGKKPTGEPKPELKPIETTVVVVKKEIYTVGGESVVYLTCDDGKIYKKQLSNDETMLFIAEGEKLTISCFKTKTEGIREIVSWSKSE